MALCPIDSKNVAEQGHIYAKTGSLGGVKSLSGYATTEHGDRIAFSIPLQ